MLKFFKHISLITCAVFISNVIAAESAVIDNRKVVVNSYKWFGEAPRAKRVKVINPFGNVTSRTSTASGVELSGVIQEIGENPPKHNIEIKDNNGVTEIVVSYPRNIRNDKGQLTGRFDLGVWIPSYLRLEVETDFGDIKVKKSASDVIAKSNSGKISIGTSGHIDAQSHSGNVSVDFYGERFREGMKVYSTSGDVKVNMSQNAAMILSAKAGNTIKNNFKDYQGIDVKQQVKGLTARLATKHKQKPVAVELNAEQGNLSINIADQVSHTVKKTPIIYSVKDSTNKIKTNKSTKDNQSMVKPETNSAVVK